MRRSVRPGMLAVAAGVLAGMVAVPAFALDRDGTATEVAAAAVDRGPDIAAAPAGRSAGTVSRAPAAPSAGPAGTAPSAGRATVDRTAATSPRPLRPRTTRTEDGAVTAFATYATHLVASPAARTDPEAAIAAVAAPDLDAADAAMLRGMLRDGRPSFAAERGGYRVLAAFRDGRGALTSVMVEVQAPLTFGDSTRRAVVGGTVTWRSDGWRLTSMRPREIPQTAQRTGAADGWRTFAGAR